MTFNFIVCQGLPGTCLYKSIAKYGNGAEHHFVIVYYFVFKDIFLEVLTKHKVKGHSYSE